MNLAELHVLGSIRRAHQVNLPAVRKAIDYLRDRFGSDHPLLDRQMLTDGKDLFIERYENLVNISQHGQMEMSQIMAVYLSRIKRDRGGIPIRLFPFTRDRYAESPELISIMGISRRRIYVLQGPACSQLEDGEKVGHTDVLI